MPVSQAFTEPEGAHLRQMGEPVPGSQEQGFCVFGDPRDVQAGQCLVSKVASGVR